MLLLCPPREEISATDGLAREELCLSVNVSVTYSQMNMEIKVHEG